MIFFFLKNNLFFPQQQTFQAMRNITTNERINHHKYEYLKDGNGDFSNPFDQGTRINMKEFFHLREPLLNPNGNSAFSSSSFSIV